MKNPISEANIHKVGANIKKAEEKVIDSLDHLRKRVFKKRMRTFVFFALAAVLAFWAWGMLTSEGLAARAIEFLELFGQKNQTVAGVFFVALAMTSVLLGPFTSAPAIPIALVLWGNWPTFWLLMAGWMMGAAGAYAVGYYFGYPVVTKIISKEKADLWRDLASRRVNFFMALLFRLSLPAETGYVFGLAKYNFWKYLLIVFIVEVLTGAVLVWGGKALIAQDLYVFGAWIGGAIIIFAAATYLLWRKWRKI